MFIESRKAQRHVIGVFSFYNILVRYMCFDDERVLRSGVEGRVIE